MRVASPFFLFLINAIINLRLKIFSRLLTFCKKVICLNNLYDVSPKPILEPRQYLKRIVTRIINPDLYSIKPEVKMMKNPLRNICGLVLRNSNELYFYVNHCLRAIIYKNIKKAIQSQASNRKILSIP